MRSPSRRRLGCLLCFLVISIASSGFAQENTLATFLEVRALSGDREAVTEQLAYWVEQSGGYYTYRSDSEIVLRVPPPAIESIRSVIEEMEAEVIGFDPSTLDYRRQIAEAEAAIVARTEALERLLIYMDGASIGATLDFERELRALNAEIESYAGSLRRIRNDIRFTRARVVLAGFDSVLTSGEGSSFAWLNDLGIYRFLDDGDLLDGYRR